MVFISELYCSFIIIRIVYNVHCFNTEHKQQCKSAMTTLDNYRKDLDRTYLGPDEENLFVALKKSKIVLSKYEDQLRTIASAPKKVFLTFEPNKTISKFFLTLKDFGEMKADQSAKEPLPVVESKSTERRASIASVQFSERSSMGSSTGNRSERGRTRLSLPNIESTFQEIELHPNMKTRKPISVGEKC